MRKSTVFVISFSKKDSLTSFLRAFRNLIKAFIRGNSLKLWVRFV